MKEFKKFITKGNVMEMAVGLIMATYFGAIVKSLVNHIIMPVVGKFIGGVDFAELKYIIEPAVPESAAGAGDGVAEIAISYGLFINSIITFLLVAFSIFWMLKSYNKMKEKFEKKKEEQPATPPEPTKEELLLTEIRDLLKKENPE